jgi:hypothetical protein
MKVVEIYNHAIIFQKILERIASFGKVFFIFTYSLEYRVKKNYTKFINKDRKYA